MSQTCFSIPTGTTNAVSISHSQSITSSVSTSTAPGSVVSSVISTCTPVAHTGPTVTGSGATPPAPTCVPVVSTVYTTHPGSTIVVTVPVTVVVDYSVTNPVTLFGTTCSTIPIVTPQPVTTPLVTSTPNTPTPVKPTTVTSTSYSTSTSTWTETSYSVFTPPPSTVVVGVTLTSGSSTIISSFTSTSTFAPSSVAVLVTQTVTADVISGQKKSIPMGLIVGGGLGGLFALLVIGFIAWKLIKRRKTNDTFKANYRRNNMAGNPEPKQHGPVGTMSPAQPPTQGFNNIGPQPSQAPAHHHRSPSEVPLLGTMGLAGAGTGAASVFNPSRPASSVLQSIGPMATPQDQTQGYPTSTYPDALQNWAVNQGASQNFGGGNTQGGYNPQGVPSSPGHATVSVPISSHARNRSVGSIGSMPSMYTTASWVGASTGQHQPPIIGGFAQNNQQQPYEDLLSRTGSPVSVSTHEQQILQVTNAPRSSVYDPNIHFARPLSSFSAGPSSVTGSSSVTTDGKGRQFVLVGEKTPIVHLDGGVFEEQPSPVGQSGSAPPAYSEYRQS